MKKSTGLVLLVTATAVAVGVFEGVRRFISEMEKIEYGNCFCDDPDCSEDGVGCSASHTYSSGKSDSSDGYKESDAVENTAKSKKTKAKDLGEGFLIEF
jgi:hypothetical protein